MNIWESIAMGAVQGLTEFLPVSSSGHLEIAGAIFGLNESNNLWFTVAVHLATVLSSIVVFRREILEIVRGVFKFSFNDQTVYLLNIVISMLPILFVGLMFKDEVEALFTDNLVFVGSMLLVTAGLLTFSHFVRPQLRPITPKRAFMIGVAQAVAVLPGLSRSGATISAALLQGVKREEAARFSFLMVIIPILGISFLDIVGSSSGVAGNFDTTVLAGFITAFLTGLFACKVMIRLVSRGKLIWFAAYCVLAGLTSIIVGVF